MQYAHNLSFEEIKTFFLIILIIRAMFLEVLGRVNSKSAHLSYS